MKRTRSTTHDGRSNRHRPKDRRAQIAAASAAAFAELGYHQVSITDIGARLGITSAALYRHFPSKYAIFAAELLRLGEVTVAAVSLPADAAAWPARQRLGFAIDGIIAGTIANRPTVVLARWEDRYLDETDKATLESRFVSAVLGLATLIAEVRPELSARECYVRAVGMFSAVSSIGDHRVVLAVKTLSALLKSLCWTMVATDLPIDPIAPDTVDAGFRPMVKNEVVLRAAIHLFYERGYPNVSVEDIATAAALPTASAVYRFYRSKSDLLTTAFRRVTDRMSAVIGPTVATSAGPAEVLSKLVSFYASDAFADRELAYVFYAESGHLPAEERTPMRTARKLIVDEWAALLVGAQPQLSPTEALVLVHAALGLVVDYGRIFGDDETLCPQGWVIWLMKTVLFRGPVPPPV